MAHISSIGAGIYSRLDFSFETLGTTAPTTFTVGSGATNANWAYLFQNAIALGAAVSGTGAYRQIGNVREFPQMGVPPNIVNVPTYGAKASRQVQGQADSPTFEMTINYIPNDWDIVAGNNKLGQYVGNGTQYAFRFTLLNAQDSGAGTSYAAAGFGSGVQNSQYFWIGKLEALQINPQLTDANTATLTVSIQSDFVGPYTC